MVQQTKKVQQVIVPHVSQIEMLMTDFLRFGLNMMVQQCLYLMQMVLLKML